MSPTAGWVVFAIGVTLTLAGMGWVAMTVTGG